MFEDGTWAMGCAFLGPEDSSIKELREWKSYGGSVGAGVEGTIERQIKSIHKQGEPISYILAAVTKYLTRCIFQEQGFFEVYGSGKDTVSDGMKFTAA